MYLPVWPVFIAADERVRADCNEVAAALLKQLGEDSLPS